jgi:hypothetical protein
MSNKKIMGKIINTLINSSVQGVDTYNHNGSTWLIFTESKQWVIELTESKTLWYNFNFFKNLFGYASLEVVQNQHLITKWVEDNVMNGSKNTASPSQTPSYNLMEVFENGIKETCWNPEDNTSWVENVIKGGVKETCLEMNITEGEVDDIIQDGVKKTKGVKLTNKSLQMDGSCVIEIVIQDGVKMTSKLESREYTGDIDDALENGVKSSNPRQYVGEDIIDKVIDKGVNETYYDVYQHKGRIDGVIKNGVKKTKKLNEVVVDWIGDIIENGVKEIKPLPDQSGELIGYGNYYHGKEDRTKAFIDYLEETLEKGVKIN